MTCDVAADGVDALEAAALDFLGFLGVAETDTGGGAITGTGMVTLGTGIVAGGGIGSGVWLGRPSDLTSTSLSSSSPSWGPSEAAFLPYQRRKQ